jgi:hypothetical protein
MAYDATVHRPVLFGGYVYADGIDDFAGDTWLWEGNDWSLRTVGSFYVAPRSGAPGGQLFVRGWGFAPREAVRLTFLDEAQGRIFLARVRTNGIGGFSTSNVHVPLTASPGRQRIKATGLTSGETTRRGFTVT